MYCIVLSHCDCKSSLGNSMVPKCNPAAMFVLSFSKHCAEAFSLSSSLVVTAQLHLNSVKISGHIASLSPPESASIPHQHRRVS